MRILGSSVRSRGGLLALVALSLPGIFAGCTPQTVVNTPSASAPTRGISVSGVGKVNGKPNVARSTIGVEARAGTADAAIAEVNARMAQVIAAVKQAGIPDADIRTATLSLNFERNYEQPPQPMHMAPAPAPAPAVAPAASSGAAPAGKLKAAAPASPEAPAPQIKLPQGFYTATNNVEVTIRNLDLAGKVLSAATSAGANQLYGLRFEIEDPSPLQTEARKEAVADARQRAERLAQLSGVKLGPAQSITEIDGGGSGPMPMYAASRADSSAPVERGEVTITSTVQIVYSLAE